MRPPIPALLAVTLMLAACTPAASAPASPSAASTSPSGTPAPAPAPSAAPSPSGATSLAPAASGSATPSPASSAMASVSDPLGGAQALAASPQPSSTVPAEPNPYELGGPAPVGSLVLGDSISLSSGVGPVLARYGYPVIGLVGQSITDQYLRTHLSSPTGQAAPAWVIELGTNNTGGPSDVARVADWIDLIDSLRTPGAKQQVYWVTPHRPPAYVGSKSAYPLDALNAELRRLDEETKWLHVIDFAAIATAHPEWYDADTAMHLHPDSRGQAVLTALVAGRNATVATIPAPVVINPDYSVASPEPTFDNSTMRPGGRPTEQPAAVPPLAQAPAPTPPAEPTASPAASSDASPTLG